MTEITEVFKPKEHNLTQNKDGSFSCSVCEWNWSIKPIERWECPGIKRYDWWKAPSNLKTKDQLARKGFRPGSKPEGCYQDAQRNVIMNLFDERHAIFDQAILEKSQKSAKRNQYRTK